MFAGGFDTFMELTGGQFRHLDTYEMEDEPMAPKKCGMCGTRDAKNKCSKCGEPYCNRLCQKADWKNHRKVCRAIQDAMT